MRILAPKARSNYHPLPLGPRIRFRCECRGNAIDKYTPAPIQLPVARSKRRNGSSLRAGGGGVDLWTKVEKGGGGEKRVNSSNTGVMGRGALSARSAWVTPWHLIPTGIFPRHLCLRY